MADAFNFPAVPRSEYRRNILKGVADWMRSRQNTEWAKRYSYVHLLIGWADDLDHIRQELESAHEAVPDLRAALDEAASALFAIKRMKPDAVREFASEAHRKACIVLDSAGVKTPLEGRDG